MKYPSKPLTLAAINLRPGECISVPGNLHDQIYLATYSRRHDLDLITKKSKKYPGILYLAKPPLIPPDHHDTQNCDQEVEEPIDIP